VRACRTIAAPGAMRRLVRSASRRNSTNVVYGSDKPMPYADRVSIVSCNRAVFVHTLHGSAWGGSNARAGGSKAATVPSALHPKP
jgi:hypothetical protein